MEKVFTRKTLVVVLLIAFSLGALGLWWLESVLFRIPAQGAIAVQSSFELTLQLPSGWKLNAKAPQQLRFYENVQDQKWKLLFSFSQKDILASHWTLLFPKKTRYRMQGIIYLCEEDPKGLCQIQQIDRTFRPQKHGAHTVVFELGKKTSLF